MRRMSTFPVCIAGSTASRRLDLAFDVAKLLQDKVGDSLMWGMPKVPKSVLSSPSDFDIRTRVAFYEEIQQVDFLNDRVVEVGMKSDVQGAVMLSPMSMYSVYAELVAELFPLFDGQQTAEIVERSGWLLGVMAPIQVLLAKEYVQSGFFSGGTVILGATDSAVRMAENGVPHGSPEAIEHYIVTECLAGLQVNAVELSSDIAAAAETLSEIIIEGCGFERLKSNDGE